jgi:hypothetical protein
MTYNVIIYLFDIHCNYLLFYLHYTLILYFLLTLQVLREPSFASHRVSWSEVQSEAAEAEAILRTLARRGQVRFLNSMKIKAGHNFEPFCFISS